MTIDEIRTIEDAADIETRKAQIATEAAEADAEKLTSLNAELDALEKRAAEIEAAKEERKAAAAEVASGKGEKIETPKETKKMDLKELRSSKEYINAYADFIKKGDDRECRALLTQLVSDPPDDASGPVPVPSFVEDYIQTAWNESGILSRVSRSYIRGVLRVGFEISATPAVIHAEGTDAPNEEQLLLGTVTLIPYTVKKWITISTEAMALSGAEFLRYVYDEITHQITLKIESEIIGAITGSPATSNQNQPAVPEYEAAGTLTDIVNAYALLTGRVNNPVIITSRANYATWLGLQATSSYGFDPFLSLPVVFYDDFLSINDMGTGVYGIIGDLSAVRVNFPEGDGVKLVYDELSLAEQDLVKIVGREYLAVGVVRPNALVKLTRGQ